MEFFLFLVLKMNELHKLSTFFILLRTWIRNRILENWSGFQKAIKQESNKDPEPKPDL